MLATLGFTITGLCFGIFAYTFNRLVVHRAKLKLSQFSYGYYSLALAFLIWGVVAAIGGSTLLKNSVIVGDSLLLIGTLFMLDIWLGNKRRAWLGLAAIVSLALVYIRVSHFTPSPYMRSGVLIFNTQTAVAITLGLIIALIWLPVNLKVAKQVTQKIGQSEIAFIYSAMYTTATISALIFLVARRTIIVVLSFIAIGVCFAMLIMSNMLVAKLTKGSHGK